MSTYNVIVHVRGGVVQDVETDDDDHIEVIVVDWDDVSDRGALHPYVQEQLDRVGSHWPAARRVLAQIEEC